MKNDRLLIMSLFLCLSTAAGCGHGSSNDLESAVPQSELDHQLLNASVNCSSSCNPSVGTVVVLPHQNPSEMGECTGFFVAPDIIATNSHCIPDSVKADPSQCPFELGAKFPSANSYDSESFSCQRLLVASTIVPKGKEGYGLFPDYAFFKVNKKTTRPFLTISRNGIPDKEKFRIMSIDPAGDPYTVSGNQVVRDECTAIQKTILYPGFNNAYSRGAALFGCLLIPGNSGSPILDSTNLVRGIAYSGWEPGDVATLMSRFGSNLKQTDIQETRIARATNLACVDFPEGVSVSPSVKSDNCKDRSGASLDIFNKEKESYIAETIDRPARSALERVLAAYIEGLPKSFKFSLRMDTYGLNFLMTPTIECVRPESYWAGSLKTNDSSFLGFFFKKRIAEINYYQAEYKIMINSDKYFHMNADIVEGNRNYMTAQIDLEKVSERLGFVGTVTSAMTTGLNAFNFLQIPVITKRCTSADLKTPFTLDNGNKVPPPAQYPVAD